MTPHDAYEAASLASFFLGAAGLYVNSLIREETFWVWLAAVMSGIAMTAGILTFLALL